MAFYAAGAGYGMPYAGMYSAPYTSVAGEYVAMAGMPRQASSEWAPYDPAAYVSMPSNASGMAPGGSAPAPASAPAPSGDSDGRFSFTDESGVQYTIVANAEFAVPSVPLEQEPHLTDDDEGAAAVAESGRTRIACGLRNLGNSCYLNATLQCLAAALELTAYFSSGDFEGDLQLADREPAPAAPADPAALAGLAASGNVAEPPRSIARVFAETLHALFAPDTLAVRPTALKACLDRLAPQFEGTMQHDAQELLRTVLDALHNELNRGRCAGPGGAHNDDDDRSDDDAASLAAHATRAWARAAVADASELSALFGGQLRTKLVCARCTCARSKFQSFLDVSLPVPEPSPLPSPPQVDAAAMAAPAPVASAPMPPSPVEEGPATHVAGNATQAAPARANTAGLETGDATHAPRPAVPLAACLAEFSRQERIACLYCARCRDNAEALAAVVFQRLPHLLVLHLKRFSVARDGEPGALRKIDALVDFPLTGLRLTAAGDDAVYDLYAVTNHHGSLASGHYTAYVRSDPLRSWLVYDDARVNRIPDAAVISPAAYLLFYRRVR